MSAKLRARLADAAAMYLGRLREFESQIAAFAGFMVVGAAIGGAERALGVLGVLCTLLWAVVHNTRPRVIVIDGEIGAGKSTLRAALVRHLRARGLRVSEVDEPVDVWQQVGAFQRFCADPVGCAYEFQTFTFVTRIAACLRASMNCDYVVAERSVLTDRWVFMELQRRLVPAAQMAMYSAWFWMFERLMPFSLRDASFVYLKPTIQQCMARTEQRGREGEVPPPAEAPADKNITLTSAPGGFIFTADGATVSASDSMPLGERSSLAPAPLQQQSSAPTPKPAGAVTPEYQASLRQAHEAFLEGKHSARFPDMPKDVIDRGNVVVVDGELASADFREADASARVCGEIARRLSARWPSLAQ